MLFGRWRDGTDGIGTDRQAERATLGAGIGYALRPRTVFSLDLSAGFASENLQSRITTLTPGVAEYYQNQRVYFESLHAGLPGLFLPHQSHDLALGHHVRPHVLARPLLRGAG